VASRRRLESSALPPDSVENSVVWFGMMLGGDVVPTAVIGIVRRRDDAKNI
jgi:hypothetical protein